MPVLRCQRGRAAHDVQHRLPALVVERLDDLQRQRAALALPVLADEEELQRRELALLDGQVDLFVRALAEVVGTQRDALAPVGRNLEALHGFAAGPGRGVNHAAEFARGLRFLSRVAARRQRQRLVGAVGFAHGHPGRVGDHEARHLHRPGVDQVLAGDAQHGVGLQVFNGAVQPAPVGAQCGFGHPQRVAPRAQHQSQESVPQAAPRARAVQYRDPLEIAFQRLQHVERRTVPGLGFTRIFGRGKQQVHAQPRSRPPPAGASSRRSPWSCSSSRSSCSSTVCCAKRVWAH